MSENRLAADLDLILDQTRDLWDDLRGERLFITGGTGFFGCWLLESFAWANDRLGLDTSALVLTRDPEAFRQKAPHLADHPAIRFHQGDARTFGYPAGTFSHVIHAATESSAKLNAENPLLMLDTIVGGARQTLDFAIQCGTRKFLLTSSGAVYGKQPPEMTHIPEEYSGAPDPLDPRSAYGEGKRMAEHLCALYAKQSAIEMKIARCFAFVGPYLPLDAHFAIGNFIRDGLNGGPIIIQGDGTPHRSYLYAADLAIWLWKILFRGKSCWPYNVGSETSMSIAKVGQLVAEQFGKETTVYVRNMQHQDQPVERYVPATRRSQEELNLRQVISLNYAIGKTIDFYRHLRGR